MPEYGPLAADASKLVAAKILLLATGERLQAIIQNPEVAEKVGLILNDPYVAFKSFYAWISIAHNLIAAILVGSSIALAAWAYRFYKTGGDRYVKIIGAFLAPFLILMIIQPIVFGHFMGEAVAHYNPTKFAMMEGARKTYTNPLIGFLAYRDPNHPIYGFDHFKSKCMEHGERTVADLAAAVGLSKEALVSLAKDLGVTVDGARLDAVLATKLRDVCLADVGRAESYVTRINVLYYTKIAGGALAVAATLLLSGSFYKIPVITSITRILEGKLGRRTAILTLATLVLIGVLASAALGWYVREVGRKPWTVYGIVYPEEVVTVVDYASSPLFLALVYLVMLGVGFLGLAAMALIALRAEEISESLRRALDMLVKGGSGRATSP